MILKINLIFKLLSASATVTTLANPARSLTAQQLRQLSPPTGLMFGADSDSSRISRRLLDATTTHSRKRKRFLELAGPRCPTILCEFLIFFEDFYFFSIIASHSLVGLDNGAMLLLGGYDWGSGNWITQTGIWELKEDQWRRIGELSKVRNKIKKKLILVFQPAGYGSAIYVSRSVYFFEGENSAIYRVDLDENEEIEAVQEIGRQPSNYFLPALFQTDSDYCT